MDFFGKPIIDHVIEQANNAGVFNDIVVSTDDIDIYNRYKPYSVIRSLETSGDVAEDLVLKEVCDYGDLYHACRIYPTAALLTPERIHQGFMVFVDSGVDCVAECQQYAHPPQRGFTIDDSFTGTYLKGDIVGKRTQDLIPVYHSAGTFMFFNINALKKPLNERSIKWLPVGEMEAQDIDTAEDFEMAKLKYMYREMRK